MDITFSTDFILLIGWEKYQALMSGKASLSIGVNSILLFTDNMSCVEKIANGKIEKL